VPAATPPPETREPGQHPGHPARSPSRSRAGKRTETRHLIPGFGKTKWSRHLPKAGDGGHSGGSVPDGLAADEEGRMNVEGPQHEVAIASRSPAGRFAVTVGGFNGVRRGDRARGARPECTHKTKQKLEERGTRASSPTPHAGRLGHGSSTRRRRVRRERAVRALLQLLVFVCVHPVGHRVPGPPSRTP